MAPTPPENGEAPTAPAPAPSVLVILHYEKGMMGFPTAYVSAPGALVLSVDDNCPDDRVLRMPTRPIPAALLQSLQGEPVREMNDDPGKTARAVRAYTEITGQTVPLTVIDGGAGERGGNDGG